MRLQAIFDHANGQVARARRLGNKGWVAAFRDATLFKTIYAFGLRRREAAMLECGPARRAGASADLDGVGPLRIIGYRSGGGRPGWRASA
jgi:integrase/recombinase XerC